MKHEWQFWGGAIVAAGIGLAVVILPATCHHIDRVDATDQLLRSVVMASRAFNTEFRQWPSSLADLTNNERRIVFMDWGKGGPVDPWGNRLLYMPYNPETECGLVISWGADGKPGGTKDNRDRIMKIE